MPPFTSKTGGGDASRPSRHGSKKSSTKKTSKTTRPERFSFKSYILRVRRIVRPGMQLSSAMLIYMDNFIHHCLEKYDAELRAMSMVKRRKTLGQYQVEIATRFLLTSCIRECAHEFGNAAVKNMGNSKL